MWSCCQGLGASPITLSHLQPPGWSSEWNPVSQSHFSRTFVRSKRPSSSPLSASDLSGLGRLGNSDPVWVTSNSLLVSSFYMNLELFRSTIFFPRISLQAKRGFALLCFFQRSFSFFIFYYFFKFYWAIGDIQCCVIFWYSTVNQLYRYTHPLSRFFSHTGYYRVPSRVPCAL